MLVSDILFQKLTVSSAYRRVDDENGMQTAKAYPAIFWDTWPSQWVNNDESNTEKILSIILNASQLVLYIGSRWTTHPFNGPFSRTTQVSRYQKGKTNLDFTEARDSEWQWHQLEHMQVCTSLQTDNHANTPPLSFLQAGCPSCHPTNSVKALKTPTRMFIEY